MSKTLPLTKGQASFAFMAYLTVKALWVLPEKAMRTWQDPLNPGATIPSESTTQNGNGYHRALLLRGKLNAASSEFHSGQRGNPDAAVIKSSIRQWGDGSADKVPARQALGPKCDPQQQHKKLATAVHGAWGGRHSRILGPSCPVSLSKSLSSLSQNTWRESNWGRSPVLTSGLCRHERTHVHIEKCARMHIACKNTQRTAHSVIRRQWRKRYSMWQWNPDSKELGSSASSFKKK